MTSAPGRASESQRSLVGNTALTKHHELDYDVLYYFSATFRSTLVIIHGISYWPVLFILLYLRDHSLYISHTHTLFMDFALFSFSVTIFSRSSSQLLHLFYACCSLAVIFSCIPSHLFISLQRSTTDTKNGIVISIFIIIALRS